MEPTNWEMPPEQEDPCEDQENPQENPQEQPEPPPTILGMPSGKERLYDRLPFTYRQVDWFIKVMLVLIGVALVVGIVTGNRT